jgi:choline dehydrogenase-like flavoprotein
MSQVIRSPKQYDVCIIGSGAGGGMAAKVLTEGGLTAPSLKPGRSFIPKKTLRC